MMAWMSTNSAVELSFSCDFTPCSATAQAYWRGVGNLTGNWEEFGWIWYMHCVGAQGLWRWSLANGPLLMALTIT